MRDGVCVTLGDVSPVLVQSPGSKKGLTNDKCFVPCHKGPLEDDPLTVLVALIHGTVQSNVSEHLDADMKHTFVKYGFLKGGRAPTSSN